MKKPMQALCLTGVLALSSFALFAQQSDTQPNQQQPSQQQQPGQQPPSQAQPPSHQTPPPQQPGDQPSQSTPNAQDSQSSNVQTFTGTIAKSGDKLVLQDSVSGTSYDIDQQDLAKKYEGQKVRIKGILDPDGKTIHVK